MTTYSYNPSLEAEGASSTDLTHLRPTTTLEMMDRAFALLRIRPALFLTLGAIYAAVNTVATLIELLVTTDKGAGPAMVVQMLGLWPFAAMVGAAFQTLLFPHRPLPLWVALRGTVGRLPHLFLTQLIVVLVFVSLGGILPIYLVQSLAAAGPFGAIFILGAMIAIGLAAFMALSWALLPVIILVERRAFFDAMGRSTRLMRMRFKGGFFGDGPLRRLLILALFPCAVLITSVVGMSALTVFPTGTVPSVNPSTYELAVVSAVEFFGSMLYAPWLCAALALLYAECRMRSEALDFQIRLMSIGSLPPGAEKELQTL